MDVQPGLRQRGRDLPHHVRYVGVGYGDAEIRFARHHRIGKVNRIADGAVLEKIADLVSHHHRAIVLGFAGRCAKVRQRHHLRMSGQFLRRKIADIAAQFFHRQRLNHRSVINNAVSRKIQQHRAFAQQLHAIGIHQIARGSDQRHVQRDEIGSLQHLFDRMRLAHLCRQAPRRINSDFRVVAEHIHTELDRCISHQTADFAQADHAQRTTGQFDAGKMLFAVFDQFVQCLVITLQTIDKAYCRHQVACRNQQRRNHQFLDGIGIGARRIEHRRATLAHFVDGNVVGAGAGAADRLDAERDIHLVHVMRAHEDAIRRCNIGAHAVTVFGKTLQSDCSNGIQCEDFQRLSHACARIHA